VGWIQGAITFTVIFDYPSALQFSPGRRSRLENYLGGDIDQAAGTWAEASATSWVDGSEPPFLLIHGLDDSTIEPEQSLNFAKVLEQAGVNEDLLPFPGADHEEIINSEQSFEAVEDFLANLARIPVERRRLAHNPRDSQTAIPMCRLQNGSVADKRRGKTIR
jgi:acetyl esterase/lipase